MANDDSRVTIHMAASLDGFIARKDGSVDWLETSDEFPAGADMDPAFIEAFLKTIDCYVMGSRTYETALRFEAQGHVGLVADGHAGAHARCCRTLAAQRDGHRHGPPA